MESFIHPHGLYCIVLLVACVSGTLSMVQDSSTQNLTTSQITSTSYSSNSSSISIISTISSTSTTSRTSSTTTNPTNTSSTSTSSSTSKASSTINPTSTTGTTGTSVITSTVTSTSSAVMPTSTTTTTTRTPSPSPPSPSLNFHIADCFYLQASNITFSYGSVMFMKTNLSHLSTLFKNYTDHVDGCSEKTRRSFTRKYYESSKIKGVKFWFKLSFIYQRSDDTWTITDVDSGNATHKNYSFSYGNCGYSTNIPMDMSYQCSHFICNGHERVSSIQSTIDIEGFRVAAFPEQGTKDPFSTYIECDSSSSSQDNSVAFLIVGVVIGSTLLIAVLIIIGSFAYKRYRYGPYNLLD